MLHVVRIPTVEFFLVFGRKLPIIIRNNPSKILKRLFISINLMWVASFASKLALMIIAKCIIVKIMVIQKALTNFRPRQGEFAISGLLAVN